MLRIAPSALNTLGMAINMIWDGPGLDVVARGLSRHSLHMKIGWAGLGAMWVGPVGSNTMHNLTFFVI